MRSARPVVALFAGLALMVVAWAAATPLGQAADEPAHYIKALAAGRGDVHDLTSGFDEFYGRYALPALVVLPLCAGAALAERGAQLAESARRRLVLAWWLEARRLAVGTDGPLYFLGEAGWTPPGGWAFWVVAMLAGAALYVSAAMTRAPIPSALSSQPTPALRR